MVFLEGVFVLYDSRLSTYVSSGKTSLIHSLAGELGLDIYVVSLSSKGWVGWNLIVTILTIWMQDVGQHAYYIDGRGTYKVCAPRIEM